MPRHEGLLCAMAVGMCVVVTATAAFLPRSTSFTQQNTVFASSHKQKSPTKLSMAVKVGSGSSDTTNKKPRYDPKWKKQQTLAEKMGGDGKVNAKEIGLIGSVPVVFKQGNATKSTMAIVGQPISDVAAQAGQFIKYGCKKGECGTCEAMCNGKWIRPCVSFVPSDLAPGEEYSITVKEIKAKAKSSGKFYSFRSIFMGFYNNLLGMVGFVKRRRAAKKNWEERMDYEELIRVKTLEKRAARLAKEQAEAELHP